MQAVPTMLELVPKGVNKGSGMRKLLANLELPVEVCFLFISLRNLTIIAALHLPLYLSLYVCHYLSVYPSVYLSILRGQWIYCQHAAFLTCCKHRHMSLFKLIHVTNPKVLHCCCCCCVNALLCSGCRITPSSP